MVTTKPKRKPAGLSDVDVEAMTRAIELTRQESPGRRDQIDHFLKTRPWRNVATFCAYCCQDNELQLKPWEVVPCWIEDPDLVLQEVRSADLGQRRRAARLLKHLLAAGLSKFEPTPLAALERAERAMEATRDNAE
jgi:hypothetical protein